jgi:hypothetical protein
LVLRPLLQITREYDGNGYWVMPRSGVLKRTMSN